MVQIWVRQLTLMLIAGAAVAGCGSSESGKGDTNAYPSSEGKTKSTLDAPDSEAARRESQLREQLSKSQQAAEKNVERFSRQAEEARKEGSKLREQLDALP